MPSTQNVKLGLPEAWIADIVESVAAAIIVINDTQHIALFNAGAQRLFGYTEEEVLGQPIEILLPERFRLLHQRLIEHFAEGHSEARQMGARRHIAGLRKGGEEFTAEAFISKLEPRDGRSALIVILRDVSDQQQREEEQRFLLHAGELLSATSLDYERTLSRVAQLATESLADWCLVYLGDASQVRLVEVAHRDADKATLAASMRGFTLDGTRPYLARRTMEERQPVLVSRVSPEMLSSAAQNSEHLHLLQQVAPCSFMGVPLLANQQVLGAMMFISSAPGRAYTPRNLQFAAQLGRLSSLALENARLYQRARQSSDARDVVLGIVAHDLRNPLNAILLSTQALRSKVDWSRLEELAQKAQRWLGSITASAQRMNRMIEDLLEVSRLEAGQTLAVNKSVQSADLILQEAFEAALVHADEFHLTVESAERLPLVVGDRERLLQVFSNLTGNALKFTPWGGRVRLGARVVGAHVEFFVADTGPGLAPEAREHLFERFWQANRHDRRGAGLGLSIVKGIVEAHGGRLRVESELDRGTTFFFTVPIAASAAPMRRPEDRHG